MRAPSPHVPTPAVMLLVAAASSVAGCSSSSAPSSVGDAGHHDAGHAADASRDGGGDRQVVVLFTSDEHSHLLAFSPELDDFPESAVPGDGSLVGGVARRLAVIEAQRTAAAAAGQDSILVSAGDNNMGTLAHVAFQTGSFDYRSLKALGYDVTTLGNHEFDFGPAALARSIGVAQGNGGLPPIVASNIHFSSGSSADDPLAALYSSDVTDSSPIHPYRVLTTSHGIKVGILGYVGVDASSDATNKAPVAFSEERGHDAGVADDASAASALAASLKLVYEDLQPVVDTLRNVEKVDLVVALSHAGVADSSTEALIEASEDWNICTNVTGIDLIVSGHAHNTDARPIEVTNTASKPCLVLNASAFGQHVGRVAFTIPADPSAPVTWDRATQALVPVNDKTVPDVSEAKALPGIVQSIEESGSAAGGESYLEGLLSLTTGTKVKNDPAKPGDLYFYPVGKTTFDLLDTPSILSLSADSMLKASDAWAAETKGPSTDLAIESAGVIRAVVRQGKTGVIAAGDAFDVVPLGVSPSNGTVGYPLLRAYLYLIEVQGVFEYARAMGATNSNFDLGMGGAQVEYDATRPLVMSEADLLGGKGQVMKITIASDHGNLEKFDKVIFQRAQPDATPPVPAIGGLTDLIPVVTSSYIAEFAGEAGVTLKDAMGNELGSTPYSNGAAVIDAVLHRPDGSEIKQLEGFFAWLHTSSPLPAAYDVSSPQATKRWVCVKGC